MILELIYGRVGLGQLNKCIEKIENTLLCAPGDKNILIVPDQYSYTAEKKLVEKFGGMGVNGIELLTFSQLFKRYLSKGDRTLLPSGKQMLLYKAVIDSADKMGMFFNSAKKPGFISEVSELVSEMKRYLITPDELRELSSEKEGMLFKKLSEFSNIYERYNELISADFIDGDDKFLLLAEYINSSDEFKNTNIYFDSFSDFMPQHYVIIEAFLESAKSVAVTLPLDTSADCEGVFEVSFKTAKRLKEIAKNTNAAIKEIDCYDNRKKSPEIEHLIKNWDTKRTVYDGEAKNISIFSANDLYSETECVARMILREVKHGRRFRDIGVMCSDMGKYAHLIEAIFADYKIPYFTDMGEPITEHPIILTLLATFDMNEENWSYESVFKYLRTGFIFTKDEEGVKPIPKEDIDKLENYVLKSGIRGKKEWFSDEDWQERNGGVFEEILSDKTFLKEDMERINSLRRTICAPFKAFYEKTSNRRTMKEVCKALYEFLCDINLYEGISLHVEKLNSEGRRNEAEKEKEIWNLILEVLDQAVITLGDTHLKKEDFENIIKEGFSKAVMQIIPPGLDSVSVCEADRNSPLDFKVGFFVGAVLGTMPKEMTVGGILTEIDRRELLEYGIEAVKDNASKMKQENFKFYKSVCSVFEKMYFSYPLADGEGVAINSATIIKDLRKMFPTIKNENEATLFEAQEIMNKKQAFAYIMNCKKENAKKIIDFYKDDEEFKNRLKMASLVWKYKKMQAKITSENAELLYNNNHTYSVSRLSDYADCPFSYFIKHGLKAKEQEVYRIQKFEIGSLLHWAVCEYCKEVEGDSKTFLENTKRWQSLSKEESDKIVENIIKDITQRILSRNIKNPKQITYLLERMKRILIRSIEIVRLSLSQGEYTAICYEEKFSVEIEWNKKKFALNGTIDRLDAKEDLENGRISLRVIDYKSGKKDFSVVSVSNNNDMQLVVYAIASTELYKKGALGKVKGGLTSSVGGILYNKLRNDMVLAEDDKDAEDKLKKEMRLDGLIVSDGNDIEAVGMMDKNLLEGKKSSDFLKVSLNSSRDSIDSRSTAVTSREKFDILTSYVKKTAVKLDEEIFNGNIEINPLKNPKTSACTYCKYKDICLYDDNKGRSRKEILKEDVAWEFMQSEILK